MHIAPPSAHTLAHLAVLLLWVQVEVHSLAQPGAPQEP